MLNKSKLQIIQEMLSGESQPAPLTKEEKQQFKEALMNFSALGESVYGKGNLKQMTERVGKIIETAQRVVTEDKDWFDEMAHKKNLKRLEEDYKMFQETAQEMSRLQERLSLSYESIGQGLNRYFDVN
jgi:hypothetical protein